MKTILLLITCTYSILLYCETLISLCSQKKNNSSSQTLFIFFCKTPTTIYYYKLNTFLRMFGLAEFGCMCMVVLNKYSQTQPIHIHTACTRSTLKKLKQGEKHLHPVYSAGHSALQNPSTPLQLPVSELQDMPTGQQTGCGCPFSQSQNVRQLPS